MFRKSVIRRVVAICLALVLLPTEVALAEHTNMAALRYEEIEDWFTHATSSDTDYASALEDFRYIMESYEQNPEVQEKDNAFLYYCYAQGMLLFDAGDYASAYTKLKDLDDLADAKGYASFAHGMMLKEMGANQVSTYEDAMAEFKEAMKCDALGGKSLIQLNECEALYNEALEHAEEPDISLDREHAVIKPRALTLVFSAKVAECIIAVSVQPGDTTEPDSVSDVQANGQKLEVQYMNSGADIQLWKFSNLETTTGYRFYLPNSRRLAWEN